MAGWLEKAGRRIKEGGDRVNSGSTSTGGGFSSGPSWVRNPGQTKSEPAIKLPDINTTRGLLARVYQMGSTNPAQAREGLTMFEQLRMDPSSVYFNPYASHTNRALDNLRDLGLEINEINDDWFASNAWLKQYYTPTANTNGLSTKMTNRRASPEEKAAYYYNQLWMAEESTKKAEQEWADLQKELSYKATQTDRPWSDDDLVDGIDWKKYPTLARMDETRMQGTPLELNRAVGYSRDALYGVIWAARNDGGTGNPYQDMINSALGTGNVYQRDDMLAAKLDPTSDSYAPYTVGSTMDKEREYFGVSNFTKEWIEENRYRLNSDDQEERSNYISVLEADAETDLADEELVQFRSTLERKVKSGKDPEQAIDDMLESGLYPTLLKMDRSIKNGYVSKTQATVNTTRKVDYDRASLLEWARGIASEKDGQETGASYAESMAGIPQGEKDTTLPKITVTQSEPGEVDAVTGAGVSVSHPSPAKPSGQPGAGATTQGASDDGWVDEIGQFGRGNIDLWNRPTVINDDGTVSTVRGMSIEEDGKVILIPTVVDGRVVSDEEAIQHYGETGEMLGEFDSEEEAQDYAERLHEQQEHLYPSENAEAPETTGSAENTQKTGRLPEGAPMLAAGEKRFFTFTDQQRKTMREWGQNVLEGYDMASDAGVLTDTEDAVLSTASAETEAVKEVLDTTPATTLADKSTVKTARANAVSMVSTQAGALRHDAAVEELPMVQERISALEGSIVATEDELDMLNMVRDAQPDWLIQDLVTINDDLANNRDRTQALLDIYRTVTGNQAYEYNSSDSEALSKAQAWADYLSSDGPMIETAYSGEDRDEDLRSLKAREQELLNTIDNTASDAAAYDENIAWFDTTMAAYEKAGVDTSEIQLAKSISDYLYSMTIYRPTDRTGNSLYQDLETDGSTPEEIEAQHLENHEKLLDAYFVRDQYIPQNGLTIPQDALDGLNREIDRLERDEKDWEYYSLRDQPNFEELAAQGQAAEIAYVDTYLPESDLNAEATGLNFGLNDAYMSHLLTPEERSTYYYLFARDGAEAAHEYYYHLEDQDYGVLTTRSRLEAEDQARAEVNSGLAGGAWANTKAIASAPLEAVAGGLYMLNRLYTGKEYNQDAYLLRFGHRSEATHQATLESILDVNGTDDGKGGKTHNAWSQVVSGMYEIVYNRGRSAANAAAFSFLGGTGIAMLDEFMGAAPMAIGAASMSIADAKDRGASDGQAYAIGTATFLAESLSEAITVSNIKGIFDAEEVTGATIKDAVINWLTSSGVEEMAGESITDIIENLTDENVMGVLSNHADDVAQYMQDHPGASETEAEEAVRRNELGNLLHTAIISYLSPGLDVAGTAVRYTGQRMGYYRDVTRDLQQRGYNVSIRETRKMLEGANQQTPARSEQQTTQTTEAPAETETVTPTEAETVTPTETETVTPTETETAAPTKAEAVTPADEEAAVEEEKLLDNAAVLESVRGTDAATQNEAIVKVLDPGSGETEFNLANAAAPGLRKLFGGQEGAISGVKAILSGAFGAGEKSELVTAALRNAGTSPSSEARKVVESKEFRDATPEQKATMLAATVEADSMNEAVRAEATKSVMEHRVARKEAEVIASGALQGVQPSVDAAKVASRDARSAEAQLEEKQQETQAAQESLKTAEKVLQNDPREGESLMRDAAQDIRNARTVEEEYTQKTETARKKEKAAKERANRDVEQAMDAVRKQAMAEVEQEDIARAEQEAKAAEQAQVQAEADEAARVRQESADNASDADFDAYMEQNNPDATEEERQHVREIWDRIQTEGQQTRAQTEVTPEQMSVEDDANRKKFLRSVGRKFGYNIVEVDEIEHNANGAYDRDTNTIRLRKGATVGDAMYFVLGHELTHITEQAGEYKPLADRLLGMFYGQGMTWDGVLADLNEGKANSPLAREVLNKLNTYQKATGKTQANDYYLQEVVADCMGKLLRFDAQHPEAQQRLVEQLAAKDPSTARKILNGIKRFLKKLVGARGAWQSDMQATVKLFENALKNAGKTTGKDDTKIKKDTSWTALQEEDFQGASAGISETRLSLGSTDVKPLTDRNGNETTAEEFRGGTVAIDTTRYSLNSFNEKEQQRTRQALLDAKGPNGKRLYTPDQVDKYMGDALGIAAMIAADRGRLDFEANPAQKFLKSNNDYYYTLDASTLCAKRLLYQGTFDYVQHALPNEVFLPEDLIDLVNIMNEMGYETPCGICYVESRRRWLDKYANEFLESLPEENRPSLDQLTTSDGLERLRTEDPDMYQAFVDAMNAKGSANPKVVQLRTEYRGDIGELTERDIQKVKDIGGLRIQSFSDFETPHLLDMVQAVYDMAGKGLTSQAYTKVPNFAWVFGDTGIKINLSLIGKGTGLDDNGNLVFDNREGMNFDEAMRLRDRYSKNVGTILVGINDEHIIAAMGDPRIDFIIPFHKSGWSQEELRKMPTLNNYNDYTSSQNERLIVGERTNKVKTKKNLGQKAVDNWIAKEGENHPGYEVTQQEDGKFTISWKDGYQTESFQKHQERTKENLANFEPVGAHAYWEFDKSGEWNARKYLQMCADAGRIPKFSQFLVDNGDGTFSLPEGDDKRSTAIRTGYWKTLIDFKMYDNEGNGAEQKAVTPNINMDQAQRVLNEHKLGRQMPDQSDGTPGKFLPVASNNDVPVATLAGDEFIRRVLEKRRGGKPVPPNTPLEATPEINVMQGARADFGDEGTAPATGTTFGATEAPAVLGNTPSTYQEGGTQNQARMAIDAETGETTRWSLPVANPVRSSDASVWQPGHTEAWFRENGFPIYQDVPLDQQEINRDTSKKGHGTQIASTESTYRKLFDRMKKENPDGWQNMRVLDASSGLGLGTQAGREQGFNVTDIEPFPNSQYTPDYTDYTELLRQVENGEIEPFDYIVSNAVLNVIPQDTRDNLVDAMGKLLAPGGKLFVNVISKDYAGAAQSNPDLEGSKAARKGSARTMEGDYTQRGNAAGRGHETFVWGSNSVQKVFSTPELIGYLKDALGDGYTVKRDSIGMTGVLVTKDVDYQETTRYSLPEGDAEAERLLNQYRTAQQTEIDLRDRKKQIDNSDEMKSWESRMMTARGDDLTALLAEYKQWETENGYADIAKAYEEAKRATKDASKAYDTYVEQKNVQEEQEKIAASGLSESDWRRKEAVKEFGYTTNVNEAGYMLPSGKMLNFTGEKGKHYGYRGQDHRAIGTIYASREKQFTAAMNAFMNDGNIRLMPESPGIDLSNAIEPTPEQYSGIRSMIRSLANKEYFSVDFSDQNGNNIGSLEYEGRVRPDKVVNDIKSFFQTGEVPQQSSLDRFRYSLPSDAPYMAAVERGEMDQAQQMVDEAAREAGYNIKVYHGTANGGRFNIFDPKKLNNSKLSSHIGQGFYFTNSEAGAREYTYQFDAYGNIKAGRDPYLFKGYLKLQNPMEITQSSRNMSRNTIRSIVADGNKEWFFKSGIAHDLQNMEINGEKYTKAEIAAMSRDEKIDLYTDYLARYGDMAALQHFVDAYEYDSQGLLLESMKEHTGNDGIHWHMRDGLDQFVAFDSSQFKDSAPVTYDDQGNVIPLSERFNTANDDIRYSIPDDTVLEQQIRQYLANGGSLNDAEPAPRADRPQKQRQWGSTRAERSPMLHDQTVQYLKDNSGYNPDTNQEQVNRAFRWIQSHASDADNAGYYGAVAEVESPDFDYRSADGQARMLVLMGMAATQGDVATELRLADAYNRQGTDLGQQLQARRIFQMMTPLGRKAVLQKEAGKINDQYKRQGKSTRVNLSPETLEEAGKAKTPEEFDAVRRKAAKELASQMPANWKDKLVAWRMLSMLGNTRTHVRNVLGNALFMPAVGIKNKVGAVTEIITRQDQRTKTLGLANSEARAFAKADAQAVKDLLTGEAKYKDGNQVEQERKAFGQGSGIVSRTAGKGLQWLIDANGKALEAEDWVFLNRHYRNALAGYMTANKLKSSDMTGKTLDDARAYAVQEAQKATYRDANKVIEGLNKWEASHPGVKFFGNAILPFKKTPANILKRGVEYSPVGLINALTRGARQVKMWTDYQNGKLETLPDKAISPTQFIDKIASGLTGTGIMILGAALSSLGAVNAGFDDDDEFKKLQGEQEYSLNLNLFGQDVSYTIDWAAPSCMPFFVGAAIMDTYKNKDSLSIESVLNDLTGITEPVFNLSMLDGVNSLLDVSQYAEGNAITQIGEKIVANYASSYVPSLMGAITRTADTTRRKSFVESGADLSTFKYAWEGIENKLPWTSTKNIPYRDVWGNPDTNGQAEAAIENFISPGYANTIKGDPVVTELERIYQADGLTDEERKAVIPKAAGKTISGMKLNAEQYDQYVVSRGQTARETLEALMESEYWQICDDPTRAKMVSEAWTYANQLAQHELTGRKLDGWVLESRTAGNVVQTLVSRAADDNKKAYIAGYGQGLAEALDADNNEDFELCLTALEDADATPAEIRTHLRNYFKPRYQSAYMAGDEDTMYDIQEKLLLAGVGFKPKDFNSWTPGEEDDEEFDTGWLTNP